MLYYSTGKIAPHVDFREATINGQAPDKGLYFPESIPVLSPELLNSFSGMSRSAIAFEVMKPYVGDAIPADILKSIAAETVDFEFPLVKVAENIFSLELFHGPTLAFKDVGARFMSRCLGYFAKTLNKKITVLVATSGDTGGAVAAGFAGVEGVNVVILYPSGKVSKVQELQLTTWGGNITALEVDGNFDDCQQMVKHAFADDSITNNLFLTSANSINVARWLPQQLYYFFALQQWKAKQPPVISVPSGNFGNICAGLLANKSGLPVGHFVAACNANDAVPNYFNTQEYHPKKAVATISNAMDVGNPSNFVRILEMFNKDFQELSSKVTAYSISDEETTETIRQVYLEKDYLLDPHGAVAYLALQKYLSTNTSSESGQKGIILETAHPVKFYDVVEPIINETIDLPPAIKAISGKQKSSIQMDNDYGKFHSYLLSL
ncbi:threonine synthase [Flavitalea sp.]|nr:threonine synthase [Flavitalea sp.]